MQDVTSERLTPNEAFALVGHETRVAILRAVMDAAEEADDPAASVSFSELRERVGMRDSGQFSYHLGKLVGPFLDHDDDGYRLRYTALLVMGSVLAGTYTERGSADPVAAPEPCPVCEGTVEATYVDERGTVACADCGEVFCSSAIPPGALEDYDPSEYPAVFERWTSHLMDDLQSGFCLACAGRVDNRVAAEDDGVTVHYECRRCPEQARTSLGSALLGHPAVIGFHWDHDIDLRDVRSWTLRWLHDDHAEIVCGDPLRAECAITLDDDHLILTVDETASVLAVERR